MPPGTWFALVCCLALTAPVVFCSSEEVSCTVDDTPSGTRYRVPEFAGSGCSYYSWANVTNFVWANKDRKLDGLVVSSTITEIVTYGCHEVMKYKGNCASEKKDITAVCKATCTKSGTQGAKGSLLKTPDINNTILNTTITNNTTTSNNNTIIIIGTVLGFLLLLLLLIIVVLCFIYRGKLCKWMKERRPAVNGNIQPANGDVERGKLLELGPVASPSQANGEIQTCGEQANSTQEDSHETGESNQEPSCGDAAV